MQKEVTRTVQDKTGHTGQRDQQEIKDRKWDNYLKHKGAKTNKRNTADNQVQQQ